EREGSGSQCSGQHDRLPHLERRPEDKGVDDHRPERAPPDDEGEAETAKRLAARPHYAKATKHGLPRAKQQHVEKEGSSDAHHRRRSASAMPSPTRTRRAYRRPSDWRSPPIDTIQSLERTCVRRRGSSQYWRRVLSAIRTNRDRTPPPATTA